MDDQQHTTTILVVEDDETIGDLLHTVLNEEPGWAATIAPDAGAARAAMQQVIFDVLVLDINLPGIGGLELLSLLSDDPAWHRPPVILMSADHQQRGIHEALDSGTAVRFIRKPMDLDDMIAAIRMAVGG
jgi:DNA-binding response OmpR family regulator